MKYHRRYWKNIAIGLLLLVIVVPILIIITGYSFITTDWSFVDTTVLGSVVAVVLGGVVASVVKVAGDVMIQNRTLQASSIDQKIELYTPIVELLVKIMSDKNDTKNPKEYQKIIALFTPSVLMHCSNRVIRHLGYLQQYAHNNESRMEMLYRYEDLLYVIREDIGVKYSLNEGGVLSILQGETQKQLRSKRIIAE